MVSIRSKYLLLVIECLGCPMPWFKQGPMDWENEHLVGVVPLGYVAPAMTYKTTYFIPSNASYTLRRGHATTK